MPIYGYQCDDCGPFSEFCKMADFDKPAPCPACGELAPREASAAYLGRMQPNNRKAHALNEKNSSEPRFVGAQEQLKEKGGSCGHNHGHGHGHTHTHTHAAPAHRPWMVGH